MRLHMRFPTRFGTRTVVKQQLAYEDALAIAEWLRAHGGEASVSEDVDLLTIPQRLRKKRKIPSYVASPLAVSTLRPDGTLHNLLPQSIGRRRA